MKSFQSPPVNKAQEQEDENFYKVDRVLFEEGRKDRSDLHQKEKELHIQVTQDLAQQEMDRRLMLALQLAVVAWK